MIINNIPITTTIDEFKIADESILLRLQILENYKTLSELQTNTLEYLNKAITSISNQKTPLYQ